MAEAHPTSDALISEFANNPDLKDIVEIFVAELPNRVAAIQSHLQSQDIQALASVAHQLKGAAGGYGFPTITDAAREVEHSAKTGEQIEKIRAQVEELADLCRRASAG